MVVAFFPLTLPQNHLNYEASCLDLSYVETRLILVIFNKNQPNWELTKQKIQISFFLKSLKVKTCQSSDKDNSLNSTPTIEQKRQIESTDKMISHPTATTWGSERVTCKDKILSATHVLKIAVNRNNLYNYVHIIYTYYRFWKMRDIIFYRFFVF